MEQTTRRQPVIAVILSLILPGLGHVYCGRPLRGLLFFCGLWAVLCAIALTGLINSLAWLVAIVGIAAAIQIIVAADAGLTADRVKEIPLRWYNRWYVYLAVVLCFNVIIGPGLLLTLQHRVAGLRTFKTPGSSMSPTLVSGDHFLARTGRPANGSVGRGELIVFPFPEDRTKTFVKRVIGLPGDRVYIKDKKVFINDRPLEDPWGIYEDSKIFPAKVMPRDNFGPLTVPANSVFVLGDNRDHSLDSRFWGCVNVKDIQAKPLFIYWSSDRSRINKRLDQ